MVDNVMVHVTIHRKHAAQIGKSIDLLNLLVANGYGYSSVGIPDPHDFMDPHDHMVLEPLIQSPNFADFCFVTILAKSGWMEASKAMLSAKSKSANCSICTCGRPLPCR